MKMLMHSSDVSNPCKVLEVAKRWTSAIMTEFWDQGDGEKEREMPVSAFMDR